MRKMKIKKFFLATLCIGVLGCLAGGIYVQDRSMPIGARAEIASGDFYIYSAGIRLVNDKNGTGLRFQTRIDKTTYDGLQKSNSVSKTGTLILPEILYQNNLTLDNTSALNIDTTDLWTLTEDETELYSIAYVYDIPASNYGSKLLATSYVAYTDGTVEYTAISPATSMMDVAKTAPAEKAEQVAPYLVENVTVKYKNVDGSLLSTETLKYGEKLTPPVVDVPDGYKFGGWCMKNGTAWDFEKWTAQGNVALQATFEKYQGKYVIAESAYETGIDVGGDSQFETTTEIAAASGFESVYKYKSTQANIHGMYFSSVDLTKYSKVFFALKTARFNFNGEATKDTNDWMYFALTQTSTATWDLKVTCNGVTIYEKTGLNGAYNSAANPAYSNNALDAILYGNPNGFCPVSKDGDLTVYVSEVRGMPGEGFTVEQMVKIADGAYEVGVDVGGGSQFTATTEIAAASGFESVYKYQSTADMIHGKSFCGVDLTKYSKVFFALKTARFNFNGEATKDTNDWMYFALTQTSTATWDLKVTCNGETIYTKTGLNGAYTTNEAYTNNALDAILYGNPSGFYPMSVDGDLTVYITELKGYVDLAYTEELPEITPVEGVKIAEGAYEVGVDVGGGSQFDKTTEIAPAKGFENVYKYQSTADMIHGKSFCGIDLTKYSQVSFALKTAKFNFNNEATQEFSDWAYFTLTQTSTATWNLSVTYNGAIVYTKAGLNGAYTTNENYTNNALDAILYGNPSGFYPMSVNGVLTVYVSELRGELAPVEYWGEKIVNSAVTGAVEAISEKETANGFEKVYKLSGAFGEGTFADVDITAYEEVRFYLTMNQALLLDDWSAYAYPNEGWTLVTLQNNLDGTNTWTVTLADRDDPSGANSFTATYTGTTLQQVLNAWYTTYDDNVLYVTDVRGIKAPAWGETVGETETIIGATQTSELQAPAGYEKLYLSNALSTSAGGNSFADVDISAYGEVRFKLKSNSYILWNGWNSIVLLKDNWMEFCLTQNADGTWNLFVDYGGGSYGGATKYEESGLAGTTLKAVLGKYEGSKQSEELVQRIYVTELRGEKKKSLTPF